MNSKTIARKRKKSQIPPTGTASFLVIGGLEKKVVFSNLLQLKIVTKKIEWMAGIGKPRMPKPFGSKK